MADDFDISAASTGEIAAFEKSAMERLNSRHESLSPVERQALIGARVEAVRELARRSEINQAEQRQSVNSARLNQIRGELAMHEAATKGDDEVTMQEKRLRAPRIQQLLQEASMIESGLA